MNKCIPVPLYSTLLPCLMIAFTAVLSSCDKQDPPKTVPQFRISSVISDDSETRYYYNDNGDIKKYVVMSDGETICKADYSYQSDGSISITAEEIYSTEKRSFDETLTLNQDGTAGKAEGEVTIDYGDYQIAKRYTADFHYDASAYLTRVDVEEIIVTDIYSPSAKPLKCVATLEWTDGDLIRHTEYTNEPSPMGITEYSYYGGENATYQPLLHLPVIRSYYIPLQTRGIFGKESRRLVKSLKKTFHDGSSAVWDYSYTISTYASESMVDEYFETGRNAETRFKVNWEIAK